MAEPQRAWSTRSLRKAREEAVAASTSALSEALTAEQTLSQLKRHQERLAGDERLRTQAFGVGGLMEIVESRVHNSVTPRVVAFVADQVITRTAQVNEAIEWVRGLGGDAGVLEHDSRLGVSLLSTKGIAGEQLYRAMVDLADSYPNSGGQPRLCVGPNEVAMRAWKVKSGGSPQRTALSLGERPKGSGRGEGVTVAVIDGGFETSDQPRTDGWADLVIPPSDGDQPLDFDGDSTLDEGAGHGTFVSGVVAQVAPDAMIRQYRAMDSFGFGNSWNVKNRIHDAIDDGCDVINLSLGSDDPDLLGSPAVSACLHRVPAGVAVVAAAGNDGTRFAPMPAAHTAALAVGALDPGLQPEVWSNWGTWVDVSTVGTVLSTFVVDPADPQPNPVRLWSGTSFAAPQVSGFLALQRGRGLSVAQAWDQLRAAALAQTGSPLPDYGHRVRIL